MNHFFEIGSHLCQSFDSILGPRKSVIDIRVVGRSGPI